MTVKLRESILLAVATIVCLLPFISKPIHIDDPVYLWTAQQIEQHPADFYGFSINWQGTRQRVHEVTKNPPLFSYYLAAILHWVGRSERALHAGGIAIALFAVIGVHRLAGRLCRAPLVATATALTAPVFLVSATTLMCDVLMLGFWCWAVYLWILGMDRRSALWLLASALAIAASILTKYFGVALIPLLLAYSLLRERRVVASMAWLLLPLAVVVAYQEYFRSLYGQPALIEAARYAAASRERQGESLLERGLMALSFTGGCLASVGLLAPLLWRRRALEAALGLLAATLVLLAALGELGLSALVTPDNVQVGLMLHVALFVVAGLGVLALALGEGWRRILDAEALLLTLWALGAFFFAGFLNWTVSARVILPMAPAVGILAARRLEAQGRLEGARGLVAAALCASLLLSLSLAWADLQYARANKQAAQVLAADFRSRSEDTGSHFFQGHWGLQFYLEPLGSRSYDRFADRLEPGDLMALPLNNSNLLRMPAHWLESIEVRRFPSSRWLTVHSQDRGAGFYSSLWGPAPFLVGASPDDVYELQRVRIPIAPARRRS